MGENPASPVEIDLSAARRLESMVAQHEPALLRYAVRFVNDHGLARDVVQDAFIRLHRFLEKGNVIDGDGSSWLYRVVHNLAVDTIRKESRLRVLKEEHAEEQRSRAATKPMREAERVELVLSLLPQLKDNERQVILLRLQEGKTYAEISGITGLSTGNIGYLIFHATQKLTNLLRKQGALPSQGQP